MTEPITTSNDPGDQSTGTEFGSPVADAVHALLIDPVATVGGELVDVEWTGGTLRLVVEAEGGITTERLAEINRLVSPLLDQHDPVPGRYLLEVSSPGVERPLRRPDHFLRAVGEQVILKLEAWSEVRRIRGELLSVDDAGVSVAAVEIDGVDLPEVENRTVSYDTIAKARTHFEWGPTPKKGGKSPKPKSKKKTPQHKPPNNKRKKR